MVAVACALSVAGCTGAPTKATASATVSTSGRVAGSGPVIAPSTSPTAPTAGSRTVTVLGSGDVLIHQQLWEQAAADAQAEGRTGYDFDPMYASIRPITSKVDLATCELESPLAPAAGPFVGWPNFNSPPQVLTALTGVGYKTCTTASNHSIDQGAPGVTRTLNELDAAGLRHTGSARSASEAATPLIITTGNGVKIAQLAYSFGFNGHSLPTTAPWLANLTSIPTILAAAHQAKASGADIVVLSMHWGTEYNPGASAEQQSQARHLLASPDIDVILGDHPHVVEPYQQINGKWVAYSMGNQIARHADPVTASREGVMPVFTFTETSPKHWTTTKVQAVSTWMQFSPYRLIAVSVGLADLATTPVQRADLRTALADTTATVNAMGAQGVEVV